MLFLPCSLVYLCFAGFGLMSSAKNGTLDNSLINPVYLAGEYKGDFGYSTTRKLVVEDVVDSGQ